MICKTDNGLIINSGATVVEISEGHLISIRNAQTGEEFLDRGSQDDVPMFELLRQNGEIAPLGVHPLASEFHYTILTDRIAEMMLSDWECDVSVRIAIDEETDDILLEPSAWTMQGGVAGLAMNVPGIRQDLQVVAPFQQGVKLPLDHPQMAGKYALWPSGWEAGFLVFDGGESGFTVQTWDDHHLYKAVKIGHDENSQVVGFFTLATGPLEQNRCVGNVCWRISAYEGNWKVPIRRYRDWYWETYSLTELVQLRPDWLDGLRLGISWCPAEPALLDALAKKIDPKSVFLHLPRWRPYGYDEDYPSFEPDEAGRAFILKAREMGFHTAPHTNTCQMSPDHPFFFQARDFCTRSPMDLRWGGWSWLPVEGWRNFGPPQSYSHMGSHKEWKILVNVHLAWSPWRRQLTRQIADLIQDLRLDSIFIDVSQLIHNSDNARVEGLSYAEGSLKLIRELTELAPGFCVSGEARNEISTQFLSVVQFHLYNFAHQYAADGKDMSWLVEGTLPVNEVLFKGLSRGIGYHYGKGENRRYTIDAALKQGAIPTLIFSTRDPVSELDGEECRYILEHANPE